MEQHPQDSGFPERDQSGSTPAAGAALSNAELLSLLQELLEGEIAGARVCLHIAHAATDSYRPLVTQLQHDEAHWCDVLARQIKRLGGSPITRAGAFYQKVMAIENLHERMSLLNRGQGWVVRKLHEALPRIEDENLKTELTAMLHGHEVNMQKVAARV